VFTVFQPDGTGRGVAEQLLTELYNQGYYRAEAVTEPSDGDVALVYIRRDVTYDDGQVTFLDYETVTYESLPVYYEGEYLIDYDTTSAQNVLWTDRVVGSGEFEESVGDVATNVDTLMAHEGSVTNLYDERSGSGGGGSVITSTGNLITEGGGDCG
jgi:hypothetical protein